MPYCEKHNREKLPSKFPDKKTGEKTFWCPDCYDEWKKSKQGNKATSAESSGNQIIMEELKNILKSQREIWKLLVAIQNGVDDINRK